MTNRIPLITREKPGSTVHLFGVADREPAEVAFDRMGERAWRLARTIVDDDETAVKAVSRAFTHPDVSTADWDDDCLLLCQVRRAAMALMPDAPAHAVLDAHQREVLELTMIARLRSADLARILERTPREIADTLAIAIKQFRTSAGGRAPHPGLFAAGADLAGPA